MTGCAVEVDLLLALERLVEHNLVRRLSSERDSRFTMLETIREFGLERLADAGEEDAVQCARAEHYLALAQRAAAELHGPDEGMWLDRLEVELPNLRATLDWLEARRDEQSALRFAGAMEWFWHMRGHPSEGRGWLERALVIDPARPSPERARALEAASLLAWQQGDDAQAIARADAALDPGRALDDSLIGAGAASTLGLVAVRQGQREHGRTLLEEALSRYRARGDRFWEALSLINLSTTFRADHSARSRLQHEALAFFRTQGSP
jgi:hypothetical protein